MPRRSRVLEHVAVVAYCALLVGLNTFPLITDLAGSLPPHHDPRLFGWVMASNTHRALEAPTALFDGNALYPYGNSIAFSEPLLVPTLVFAPVFRLSANPVLAYNVTLLAFWLLSGWTFYYAARELAGNRVAALAGATAFLICPYRIDYYLEFQMELVAAFPLVLLFWYRALTRDGWRHVILAMIGLWLTMISSIYYGIILGLGLGVFALAHLLMRPRAWDLGRLWRLSAATGVCAAAALPILIPYAQTRSELGFERSLANTVRHSADLLTYFTTRSTQLYRFELDPQAETTLFMGFTVLGLAAFALLRGWWAAAGAPALPRWLRVATLTSIAVLAGEALLRATAVISGPSSLIPWLLPLLLGLAVLVLAHRGRNSGERAELGARELSAALALLALTFFILSLGPWVRLGGEVLGRGLHGLLFAWVPLFQAVRVMTRFGVIVVLAVSLLATIGMAALLRSLRPENRAVVGIALLVLINVEAWSAPLAYEPSPWPPLDSPYEEIAKGTPTAVLEIPVYADKLDCWYMFNSALHWQYVVNGFSGFVPPMTTELAKRVGRYGDNLLDASTRQWLRQIHPLKRIVVHTHAMPPRYARSWRAAELPDDLVAVQVSPDHIVLSLVDVEETAAVVTRLISPEHGRLFQHVSMRARLEGTVSGTQERVVTALVNGVEVATAPARAGFAQLEFRLPDELPIALPTMIEIAPAYVLREKVRGRRRYRIGTTGIRSPADLDVVAVSQTRGLGRIRVNGAPWTATESARNLLVAVRPADGSVVAREAFAAVNPRALARALERLPDGTIVCVAFADVSRPEEVAEILRSVGAGTGPDADSAYAMIGVKGAATGTATEVSQPNRARRRIGTERLRAQVTSFETR